MTPMLIGVGTSAVAVLDREAGTLGLSGKPFFKGKCPRQPLLRSFL